MRNAYDLYRKIPTKKYIIQNVEGSKDEMKYWRHLSKAQECRRGVGMLKPNVWT